MSLRRLIERCGTAVRRKILEIASDGEWHSIDEIVQLTNGYVKPESLSRYGLNAIADYTVVQAHRHIVQGILWNFYNSTGAGLVLDSLPKKDKNRRSNRSENRKYRLRKNIERDWRP